MTTVEALDERALVRILIEPRNALIKQFQRLFELDEVELEFTDEAIAAIAAVALRRGIGARGPNRGFIASPLTSSSRTARCRCGRSGSRSSTIAGSSIGCPSRLHPTTFAR